MRFSLQVFFFVFCTYICMSLYSSPGREISAEEKLSTLRRLVDIEFKGEIAPYWKKEGIHYLFEMVFASDNFKDHFGPGKTVEKIFLIEPDKNQDQESVDLYDHFMLFPCDGSHAKALLKALDHFRKELNEIELLHNTLSTNFPHIIISRISGYLSALPASNRSHINNLQAFLTVATRETNFKALSSLSKIYLNDSSFSIYPTRIKRYTSFHREDVIDITFGRDSSRGGKNHVDITLINHFFDIIFFRGFSSIDTFLLCEKEIKEAVGELHSFLTHEMTSLLINNGVDGFLISRSYQNESNLFSNGILTLGQNRDAMLKTVQKVFSDN